MAVEIFQRILQSDDVAFPGMVDPVDQAGIVVDLPLPAEPVTRTMPRIVGDIHHILRNGKLCRIRQPEGDHADHGSQGTTLLVGIDTKSGNTGNGKRKSSSPVSIRRDISRFSARP